MNTLSNITSYQSVNTNAQKERQKIPASTSNNKKTDILSRSGRSHLTGKNITRLIGLVHEGTRPPLEGRVKRSTLTNQPVAPSPEVASPDRQGGNRHAILQDYEHLINLDGAAPISPVCTTGVEGQPNPPVYPGYSSWEAFLASDGSNSEIKNPRQELVTILQPRITAFILNRSRELFTDDDYNDLRRRLNSCRTPEAARAEVERYRALVNGEYVQLAREIRILSEAITKKMTDAIRDVRHNAPNRWIRGHCWSSTTRIAQWDESWRSRYLPKALQAMATVQGLDTSLISIRQIWENRIQPAIDALKARASSQGWGPMEIPLGNPPETV